MIMKQLPDSSDELRTLERDLFCHEITSRCISRKWNLWYQQYREAHRMELSPVIVPLLKPFLSYSWKALFHFHYNRLRHAYWNWQQALIGDFEKQLKNVFMCKLHTKLANFPGWQLRQNPEGIFIRQAKNINMILLNEYLSYVWLSLQTSRCQLASRHDGRTKYRCHYRTTPAFVSTSAVWWPRLFERAPTFFLRRFCCQYSCALLHFGTCSSTSGRLHKSWTPASTNVSSNHFNSRTLGLTLTQIGLIAMSPEAHW